MKSSNTKPTKTLPGGAANVCYQFKHLNVDAALNTLLNFEVEKTLNQYNINTDPCAKYTDIRIPIKRRYYDGDSPFCRHDIEQENYGLHEFALQSIRNKFINDCKTEISATTKDLSNDYLILSDYDKGFFKENSEEWTQLGIPTIIDPKNGPIEKWKGCTIFKPNSQEAAKLSSLSNWKDQAIYFLNILQCQSVVITQSGKGVVGWDGIAGDFFEYVNPTKKIPRSVIGAGDCFCAFLALAFAHKFNICECAEIAFKAAASYVDNIHNHPISLYDLMRTEDPYKAKYMMPERGEGKLVFTNGCFDILHANHVKMLQFAKSRGDKLVVALNSDASVRRLKGESRPIVPLKQRIEIVAALDCVDFVCAFYEDTPLEIIKTIKPDYIVKGGDYRKEEVVGHDLVEEVFIYDYQSDQSTTKIIEKCNFNVPST
jgi:D-beta-D-heptose 7-phosphate kinase/D-beta-D-heptose 1-phosphate adenosyltransferase